MNAKKVLIAVVAAMMLLLSASVAYAQTTTGAQDGDNSFKGSVSVQELAKVDEAAAREAALKAVPGTVEEIDLETDDNGYLIYKVEVAGNDGQSHDLTVDAGNGEILLHEDETQASEEDGSYKGSVSVQELAKVDEAAAREAALQAAGGGTVEEIGAETENGYVVYNVEVAGNDGQSHDLTVDAGNGEILHQESEASEPEDSD